MREQGTFWQRLVAGYMAWSPLIAGYLMAFFLIFFAGAYIYGLGEFLTSQATTGWAAAIASAGAAIVALVIARNARDQNEKERRNDREYNETQRSNDQAYAEKLRREDLARVARAQNEQIQEEARRRSEMAGKQMSVFIGRFYQAKSAFHGIKRLLRESDTANAQTLAAMTDEIYPRLLAMIGHFEAIPIATAYDYDPKLGAHLSYLLDWLRGMELGCRGWPNHDHRVHVKKGAHCVENGLIHVEPILKHMQSIYRDMHLSEVERAGYVPPDNP